MTSWVLVNTKPDKFLRTHYPRAAATYDSYAGETKGMGLEPLSFEDFMESSRFVL